MYGRKQRKFFRTKLERKWQTKAEILRKEADIYKQQKRGKRQTMPHLRAED